MTRTVRSVFVSLAAAALLPACREPLKCQAPTKACGELCCPAPEHGAATCDGAVCGFTCEAGFHRAGGACVSDTSVTSCGPSALDCTVSLPAHSAASCAGDPPACGFSCEVGYHRDGAACASDTSVTSCGPLGADCTSGLPAHASPSCDGIACGFVCESGRHKAGGECVDDNALTSCGPSGTNCTSGLAAHASATCDGVTCGFDCDSDYHENLLGTACDADTSVASCGVAASDCNTEKPANATATCSGTSCGFECLATFHSCDGVSCSSNFSTATCGTSCTACETKPNGYPTCNGTACGFDCDSDFHKNLLGTSCDADTSVTSCGQQARDCSTEAPPNSDPTCTGAACGFSCKTGYCPSGSSCVSKLTDPQNCGSCGHSCGDNQACAAGQCSVAFASCKQIKQLSSGAPDGTYPIDPDGPGGAAPFNAYCDMNGDGGGWTLWAKVQGDAVSLDNTGAIGTLTSPAQTTTAKLADSVINLLKGGGAGKVYRASFNYQSAPRTLFWTPACTFSATRATAGSSDPCTWYYTSYAATSFTHTGDGSFSGLGRGLFAYYSVGPSQGPQFAWALSTNSGNYTAYMGNCLGDSGGTLVTWWARSGGVRMPDSPTVYCLDGGACPTSGSGYGQDGNYQIDVPSYVVQTYGTPDNTDDDTVIDTVSGLMWQRGTAASSYNWDGATSYCSNLTHAGTDDWRLPSRVELVSILDLGRATTPPLVDLSVFPGSATSFWSSSLFGDNFNAKCINMNNLADSGGGCGMAGSGPVRCVRGSALATGTYVSTTTNTVVDEGTGLMWQKTFTVSRNWLQALSDCEGSALDGYTDWRLPSMKELHTIVRDGVFPTIDSDAFPGTLSSVYWSSSPGLSAGTAMAINFDAGRMFPSYGTTQTDSARCVRQ